MLQFLEAYFTDILSLIETLIFVIVAMTLTRKMGNPKFLQGAFDIMYSKYKTEANTSKTVGQKFEHTAPVYELNKDTGELVKTDKVINIDELVNSSKDQSLNSIYDRFLPDDNERASAVFDVHSSRDLTLDSLRESFEVVEGYRTKYKLPDDMEPLAVLDYVKKHSEKVKQVVQQQQQAVELKEKTGGAE